MKNVHFCSQTRDLPGWLPSGYHLGSNGVSKYYTTSRDRIMKLDIPGSGMVASAILQYKTREARLRKIILEFVMGR
jgi:hypothetical protein